MPFPTRLEKQYERQALLWFDAFANNLIIELDQYTEKDDTFQTDSINDIFNFIDRVAEKSSGLLSRFSRGIKRTFFSIDKQAINETEGELRDRLNLDIKLPESSANVMLTNRIAMQDEMWSDLYRQHHADIKEIIEQAFREGISQKTLIERLMEKTGVNRSKAAFWAQDQTGWAFSDMQKKRQSEAGFPGYIWRSKRDGRVRDTHGEHEGKFFKWSEGANINGRMLHPGQDFNCRCHPEPAFDYAEQDTEEQRQAVLVQIERKKELVK